MGALKEQYYLEDNKGKKVAIVIPISQYNKMIEELEDLEDVRLYDEAKKNDTGERIPMEEAFKMIDAKRRNKK